MKRLPLRLIVAALALFGVFVLTSVYVYQSFLGGSIAQRPTVVTVELDQTGGLFERSSVTYRGVKVGHVRDIRTTPTGVEATIAIDAGVEVPASARAVVRNLSPAGEQFLDLQPPSSAGPALRDGDTIGRDDSATPTTVAESLHAIDTLMSQVDPADLEITLDELSTAFADPADLATIVDRSQEVLATLDAYWPETERVVTTSETVLRTGVAVEPQLRALAPAAHRLTTWLQVWDPKLRSILSQTPSQVTELRSLTSTVAVSLPSMLASMTEFTDAVLPYRPHLWQFLHDVPDGFTAFASTVGGGYLHTAMFIDTGIGSPAVCRYVPDDPLPHHVGPLETSVTQAVAVSQACWADHGLQGRGAGQAPGPVAKDVALSDGTQR